MVGLVVATHGALAEGLKNAAHMLAGDAADFTAVGLVPGMEPSGFQETLREAIEGQNTGDGVIVLVDLFGGTPSNCTCRLLAQEGVRAISGVNLPILLEAVFSRDGMSVDQLAEHLAQVGATAIFDIGARRR